MYKTCIPLRKNEVDKAIEVCESISLKDQSFMYKLRESALSGYDNVLVIYSRDKNTAYKRGQWFISNVIGNYYWVKS